MPVHAQRSLSPFFNGPLISHMSHAPMAVHAPQGVAVRTSQQVNSLPSVSNDFQKSNLLLSSTHSGGSAPPRISAATGSGMPKESGPVQSNGQSEKNQDVAGCLSPEISTPRLAPIPIPKMQWPTSSSESPNKIVLDMHQHNRVNTQVSALQFAQNQTRRCMEQTDEAFYGMVRDVLQHAEQNLRSPPKGNISDRSTTGPTARSSSAPRVRSASPRIRSPSPGHHQFVTMGTASAFTKFVPHLLSKEEQRAKQEERMRARFKGEGRSEASETAAGNKGLQAALAVVSGLERAKTELEKRAIELEERLATSETQLQEEKAVTRALDQELQQLLQQHERVKKDIHVELASVRKDLRGFIKKTDTLQRTKTIQIVSPTKARPNGEAGNYESQQDIEMDIPAAVMSSSWVELESHVASLHAKAQDFKDAMLFWKKRALDAERSLTRSTLRTEDVLLEEISALKQEKRGWMEERAQLLDLLDALQSKNGDLYDKWWNLHLQHKGCVDSEEGVGRKGSANIEQDSEDQEIRRFYDSYMDQYSKVLTRETGREAGRVVKDGSRAGTLLQEAQDDLTRARALVTDGESLPDKDLLSPQHPRVFSNTSNVSDGFGRGNADGGQHDPVEEKSDIEKERKQRKKLRKQRLRKREQECEMMYKAFMAAANATGQLFGSPLNNGESSRGHGVDVGGIEFGADFEEGDGLLSSLNRSAASSVAFSIISATAFSQNSIQLKSATAFIQNRYRGRNSEILHPFPKHDNMEQPSRCASQQERPDDRLRRRACKDGENFHGCSHVDHVDRGRRFMSHQRVGAVVRRKNVF